eukprot:6389060-Prymnesium_polylepis.1
MAFWAQNEEWDSEAAMEINFISRSSIVVALGRMTEFSPGDQPFAVLENDDVQTELLQRWRVPQSLLESLIGVF